MAYVLIFAAGFTAGALVWLAAGAWLQAKFDEVDAWN